MPANAAFLAQFWGLLFVIMGAIYLVRQDNIRNLIRSMEDDHFIVLTGFMALVMGILSVLIYNEWQSDWTLIVTLIGWISLLKGVVRLAFPSMTQSMIKKYDKPGMITVSLGIMILVGGYLVMKGFGL